MKKIKSTVLVCTAVIMCILAALMSLNVINVLAENELKEASWCSFIIPSEFEPSTEPGLFRHKNYPMESSSIKYSCYYNGEDILLTNREKAELSQNGAPKVADDTQDLTKEIYEQTISSAYNTEYGQDVGYTVSSFDNITIDGYPGYKIASSYQAAGEEKIYQTVIMMVSKYKTFTITYQRAEDDYCEESFEESANSIHVN